MNHSLDHRIHIQPMTASECKNGGESLTIYYDFYRLAYYNPFGEMLIASTNKGICYLGFASSDFGGTTKQQIINLLEAEFPHAKIDKHHNKLHTTLLDSFALDNKKNHDDIWLHIKGTEFQFSVWQQLLQIPLGGLASYSDIAKAIGQPKAARAVGNAVGSNPVSFFIPCHRVIQTNGSIGGYLWGIERKRAIIAWEAQKALSLNETLKRAC